MGWFCVEERLVNNVVSDGLVGRCLSPVVLCSWLMYTRAALLPRRGKSHSQRLAPHDIFLKP